MHMSCGGSDVCSSNLWAIVGESGSGKSVLAQSVLGILPASGRITAGRILLDAAGLPGGPVDLAALGPASKAYQTIRGGHVSIIFQEPMTSLSPLHTVGNQIVEAVRLHRPVSAAEAVEISREMLGLVGFPEPGRALDRKSTRLNSCH